MHLDIFQDFRSRGLTKGGVSVNIIQHENKQVKIKLLTYRIRHVSGGVRDREKTMTSLTQASKRRVRMIYLYMALFEWLANTREVLIQEFKGGASS